MDVMPIQLSHGSGVSSTNSISLTTTPSLSSVVFNCRSAWLPGASG
jgi:hypothetical protein